MEEMYRISGERLTGIADQARRLGQVAGELTPAQMEETLSAVVPAAGLANAEEYAFGRDADGMEDGIIEFKSDPTTANNNYAYYCGWCFQVNEPLSFRGFKVKGSTSGHYASAKAWLVRVSDEKRLAYTETLGKGYPDVSEELIDTPVDLEMGETYAIYVNQRWKAAISTANVTINKKISWVSSLSYKSYSATISDVLATASTAATIHGVIYPILGTYTGFPEEYKVQRTTMDDIAMVIQRVTGANAGMTPGQMISVLEQIGAV